MPLPNERHHPSAAAGRTASSSPTGALKPTDLERTRLLRTGADITLELTERELRSLHRACCLVLDVLAYDEGRWRAEPHPLQVARSVLASVAERHGIDLHPLITHAWADDPS